MLSLANIEPGEAAKLIAVSGIFIVIIISTITRGLTKVLQSKHREETRREIAAYVAEGTISPQDAALIIASGPDDYRKRIADAAAILNSPATPFRA